MAKISLKLWKTLLKNFASFLLTSKTTRLYLHIVIFQNKSKYFTYYTKFMVNSLENDIYHIFCLQNNKYSPIF